MFGWAACLQAFQTQAAEERRKLYGFDSFERLSDLAAGDSSPQVKQQEMRRGGFHAPAAYGPLFDFVEAHDRCELYRGWFNKTLPGFFRDRPHVSFAMVHVDSNLYESTKDVLEATRQRVSPGGVVVFDELLHPDYPGETVALRELLKDRDDFSLHRSAAKPDKRYLVKHLSPGTRTPVYSVVSSRRPGEECWPPGCDRGRARSIAASHRLER